MELMTTRMNKKERWETIDTKEQYVIPCAVEFTDLHFFYFIIPISSFLTLTLAPVAE